MNPITTDLTDRSLLAEPAATTAGLIVRRTVSPEQCRAGRALLNWSQAELAGRAGVARKTVTEFEIGSRPLNFRTRRDITLALEAGGVLLLWDEAPYRQGVLLRR